MSPKTNRQLLVHVRQATRANLFRERHERRAVRRGERLARSRGFAARSACRLLDLHSAAGGARWPSGGRGATPRAFRDVLCDLRQRERWRWPACCSTRSIDRLAGREPGGSTLITSDKRSRSASVWSGPG